MTFFRRKLKKGTFVLPGVLKTSDNALKDDDRDEKDTMLMSL